MVSFQFKLFENFFTEMLNATTDFVNSLTARIVWQTCDIGQVSILFEEHQHHQFRFSKTMPLKPPPMKRMKSSLSGGASLKAAKLPPSITSASLNASSEVITSRANADALINASQNLSTGVKSFTCSLCPYGSSHKSHVKRHIEMKHLPNATVFECQTCGKTTKLKYDLKKHYMTKHGLPEKAAQAMVH